MANKVVEQKLIDNNNRTLVKYVVIPDGTATANSSLLSFSTLNFAMNATGHISSSNPKSNYRVSIKRIYGQAKLNASVTPTTYVALKWLNDSNTEIVTFGSGHFDYSMGSILGDSAVIPSPAGNTTGLAMTINSPTNGDTFTVLIDMKKDARDFDAGQTADPAAFNRGTSAL